MVIVIAVSVFRRNHEVRPPVSAPRVFLMSRIEREFTAVADRPQPIRVDAKRNQIRPRRDRSSLAKRQIVLRRSSLVAVAFDRDRPTTAYFFSTPAFAWRTAAAGIVDIGAVVLEEDRPKR